MITSDIDLLLSDVLWREGQRPDADIPSAAPAGERFWVGPENVQLRMAVERFCEVWLAARDGERWERDEQTRVSPLVIWGAVGCGKTLLARELASWWNWHWPQERAVIDTASDFARAFRDAAQLDDLENFREKIDTARLLILEDVHRVADQMAVQTEMIRVLQERLDAGLPTVLTSLAPGGSRSSWIPQLSSRIGGGLMVQVVPAAAETRQVWLGLTARQKNVHVESDALRFLAERTDLGFRQLAGLLTTLGVDDVQAAESVTTDQILAHIGQLGYTGSTSLAAITKATAQQCRVRVSQIRGKSRRTGIMRARSLAMYLARQCTPLSLQRIGEYFSGRDHTTVMHACRKIETLLQQQPELKTELEEIRLRCMGQS